MKETAREIQEFLYLLYTWKVQQDRESFMDLRHRFPSLGFPNTFFMRNIYWTNHSLLQSLLLTAYLFIVLTLRDSAIQNRTKHEYILGTTALLNDVGVSCF